MSRNFSEFSENFQSQTSFPECPKKFQSFLKNECLFCQKITVGHIFVHSHSKTFRITKSFHISMLGYYHGFSTQHEFKLCVDLVHKNMRPTVKNKLNRVDDIIGSKWGDLVEWPYFEPIIPIARESSTQFSKFCTVCLIIHAKFEIILSTLISWHKMQIHNFLKFIVFPYILFNPIYRNMHRYGVFCQLLHPLIICPNVSKCNLWDSIQAPY